MPSFGEVTTWSPDGPDAWIGEVPAQWMQGRASFGGLVAAVGLRALRSVIDDGRAPRSIHTSFFAPLGPGPARVTAQLVRRGRFVTHGRAELWQAGSVLAQIIATFADDRDSGVVVAGPPRPERPGPEGLAELPFIQGVIPEFTRFFAFRWTDGSMPFSGAKTPGVGGWCRHRSDPGTDPHVALMGLLDAWPPPVVPMLEHPAPSSSVTWNTLFYDVPAVIDAEQWWWYGSEAIAAGHGYAGMRARIYGPSGRLAATVEQLVAVFDRAPK